MRTKCVLRAQVLVAAVAVALGVADALGAVSLFQVPDGPGGTASNIRALNVDSTGLVYVAGQAKNASAALNAAYWTFNGTTVSAANIVPTNAASVVSVQANGIGVLSNGDVIVGGTLTSPVTNGVADWSSQLNGASGGWTTRIENGTTQANTGGDSNQITIQASGTRYYNVGKNSAGTFGVRFDVNGVVAGRASTSDRFDMRFNGASGSANSNNSVVGASVNGIVTGQGRDSQFSGFGYTNIRRAYVRESGTSTLLPGSLSRFSGECQSFGISADGSTIVGMGFYADGDTINRPMFWTRSGPGSWVFHTMQNLPGSASTSVARGVSQSGRWAVGSDFVTAETGVFWDTTVVDGFGNPVINETLPWLAAHGADVSGWTRLGRTYSAYELGDGRVVIAGDGVTTDGTIRGFIAIIPEPASVSLLALGSMLMLRRRSR